MLITEVKASKIRRTRHRNLRQGKPFSTTTYKKDNDKKTFHLACIYNNIIISCATFYPENNSFFSKDSLIKQKVSKKLFNLINNNKIINEVTKKLADRGLNF